MKLKNLNYLLFIVMLLVSTIYGINAIKDGKIYLILIRFSIIPVMLAPFFLHKFFKIDIPVSLKTIYLVFIFFSHFLGSIVGLYNEIYCYDKIIHFISGVLTALIAIYLIYKTDFKSKNKLMMSVIFIISFTMLVASFWEIFEYTSDHLFLKDAQKVKLTGVNDTMQDMIVALLGAILVSLSLIYEKVLKVKLLISHFIKTLKED